MKILVIDDLRSNLDGALKQMSDHEVVVEQTLAGAVERLSSDFSFDAVMTDVYMEADYDDFSGGPLNGVSSWKNEGRGKQMFPAGLVFALRALQLGCPRVLICSDRSHHGDLLTALLDVYTFGRWKPEGRVSVDYYGGENDVKDWRRSAGKSGLFPEFAEPVVPGPPGGLSSCIR